MLITSQRLALRQIVVTKDDGLEHPGMIVVGEPTDGGPAILHFSFKVLT